MLKTQKILDAAGTISIDDFEAVLDELVEWYKGCTTHEELVSGLKRYMGLFDEDVLRLYNDAYKVSNRWYNIQRRNYNEIKDDIQHTQDEINDAWFEVDDAKSELDEMRKLPRSVTKTSQDDYKWLMSQLRYIDNESSHKTLDEGDMGDVS